MIDMDEPAPRHDFVTADAETASAVSDSGPTDPGPTKSDPASAGCVQAIVNGVHLLLDPSGAVYWPNQRALIVADLHLEKGSAFASRGRFLPPYDTAHTLDRLTRVIRRFDPARVICLGDSFHDPAAGGRIAQADLARLATLMGERDWVWVSGNHDPTQIHPILGESVGALRAGPLVLRHEAEPDGISDLSGHFHPTALVATRARRVRRRCFVHDESRLILPAFGAYTGGLNILTPVVRQLLERGFKTWLIGDRRLYAVPHKRLIADNSRATDR